LPTFALSEAGTKLRPRNRNYESQEPAPAAEVIPYFGLMLQMRRHARVLQVKMQ